MSRVHPIEDMVVIRDLAAPFDLSVTHFSDLAVVAPPMDLAVPQLSDLAQAPSTVLDMASPDLAEQPDMQTGSNLQLATHGCACSISGAQTRSDGLPWCAIVTLCCLLERRRLSRRRL